jgi:sulfur-oxidizing protein SoxA
MKRKTALAYVVGGLIALGTGGNAAAQMAMGDTNMVGDMKSDYHVSTSTTQTIQSDDFTNGAFLWVDQGEELWSNVEGAAGKSCASCHDDATKTMKGVGATYPKYNAGVGKMINLEHRINLCREQNMQAKPWKWESDQLLGMTAYVKLQSRGMPVNVSIDGPARPFYEKGKKFYFQRRGMMDVACAQCHIDNEGKMARADLLGQGHSNGFPTYRLKWQKFGSLHRRFRGCNKNIRAQPYKAGSDEYTNLELFVSHRGNGLKVETPSVRR